MFRHFDIANALPRKAHVVQTTRHDLDARRQCCHRKGAGKIVVAGLEVTDSLTD